MAIIIKGDNKGIAVDGNLTIKHLDFQFGQGVRSASGVRREVTDAEVVEEKPAKPQYPFVTIPALTDDIVSKIRSYLEGKTPSQAKDVMKPIRAAQDAGVIRRITFEEMKAAFPEYCPNSKASVSKYTKEDETSYIDEAFKDMVEEFQKLKNNRTTNEEDNGE